MVEHTPRGRHMPSVDALRPGDARNVGVRVEQVQGLLVVGHLVGAIGPHDDPKGALVDARPSFGPRGGEDRWPGHRSADLLTSALVATLVPVGAQGVDGEARAGEDAEVIVHHDGQYVLVGSGAADRGALDLYPSLTRGGPPPPRLDEVPDARRTGHWVEQVGPVRFPRRLVQEEPVQRQTGVGHLLHAREHVGAGHRPEEAAVHPRPGDGGTLGQERRPEDAVARLPDGVRVVAARVRLRPGREHMEPVRREYVQRATGVGARTDDQHPAKGCRCRRHGRRAGRGTRHGVGA